MAVTEFEKRINVLEQRCELTSTRFRQLATVSTAIFAVIVLTAARPSVGLISRVGELEKNTPSVIAHARLVWEGGEFKLNSKVGFTDMEEYGNGQSKIPILKFSPRVKPAFKTGNLQILVTGNFGGPFHGELMESQSELRIFKTGGVKISPFRLDDDYADPRFPDSGSNEFRT